jgi:serine/threonine protein kinase
MQKKIRSYQLKAGRKLGSLYQIRGFLGEGWEGEVYKVVEISTGIERAAKLYYPQRNPRGRTMAKYIKKLHVLKHVPVVLQYHHLDKARIKGEQVEFMISEYVEGELLSDMIHRQAEHRFDSFEALNLLHAIVSGVEQIHRAGEYHGDLHRRNILVTRQGIGFKIKILDFQDFGKSSRENIFLDVTFLAYLLYEMVGGKKYYKHTGPEIKSLVKGLKHGALRKSFRNAGDMRLALENIEW